MNNYTQKAWTVIGYAWNGSAYCPECLPEPHHENQHGEIPAPIFTSDEFYLIDPKTNEQTAYPCDTCGQPIE